MRAANNNTNHEREQNMTKKTEKIIARAERQLEYTGRLRCGMIDEVRIEAERLDVMGEVLSKFDVVGLQEMQVFKWQLVAVIMQLLVFP